ncbi:hypothetical protein HAX54_040254 [Datura stramonium]|uniref:Uncharacterized protein n=1 Tax=Datura stramonium TaxID=4076 RepID=A0ABS8SJV2_DATST|nr:hypothetical protein [Datura stramonium]
MYNNKELGQAAPSHESAGTSDWKVATGKTSARSHSPQSRGEVANKQTDTFHVLTDELNECIVVGSGHGHGNRELDLGIIPHNQV